MADLGSRIGFGCMRLATSADRERDRAVGVVTAALDAGAGLLDTADVYCLDDSDLGCNGRFMTRPCNPARSRPRDRWPHAG